MMYLLEEYYFTYFLIHSIMHMYYAIIRKHFENLFVDLLFECWLAVLPTDCNLSKRGRLSVILQMDIHVFYQATTHGPPLLSNPATSLIAAACGGVLLKNKLKG